MPIVLHPADSRGMADHGWLKSFHSFSFANYYDPKKMNFGVLRVLNDDFVAPGMGFGTHSHDNMEIISIPLEGDLEHKDSIGNTTVIKEGDIQVMSAGTGVYHSEYNKNNDKPVKFLQIWVIPNKKNVTPRYDQITIEKEMYHNKLFQILSPSSEDEGVWIHQDAWFYISETDDNQIFTYSVKKDTNGIYIFLLEGSIVVEDQRLTTKDAIGLWDIKSTEIIAKKASKFIIMDIPMTF